MPTHSHSEEINLAIKKAPCEASGTDTLTNKTNIVPDLFLKRQRQAVSRLMREEGQMQVKKTEKEQN